MNAEVEIKKHLAYVLPTDAIVSYHEKQFVYIAKENNQFEMITVTTGASKDGYTEVVLPVVNNLANADIVIKGAYSILMMMKNKEE
jgi:cobalt-zinc-cadmium efflux system membrane fusion protein